MLGTEDGADRWDYPDHPALRQLAEALDENCASFRLWDSRWRLVYVAKESRLINEGRSDDPGFRIGVSCAQQSADWPPEWPQPSDEAIARWIRDVFPVMRHDVRPEDDDFEFAFGDSAASAAAAEGIKNPPLAFFSENEVVAVPGRSGFVGWYGTTYVRLRDTEGSFLGHVELDRFPVPESVIGLLARGNLDMFQRMATLRDPIRRPAAVLFADLEASGALSRALPSASYFELIRSLTDVIDDHVAENHGIIGKHAGDGASALFVVDEGTSESDAARAAIQAARGISEAAAKLLPDGPDVRINIGLHWGATMTIGQVSTRGRLEVTALGDEMNEAARIENVAKDGATLASKMLIERLDDAASAALGLDTTRLTYRQIADLQPSDKALRDAGAIPVVDLTLH